MSDPASAFLVVRNLHSAVLRGIDLTLAKGEGLAVTGPSGSGKTSLFRALADLDPNAGDVTLDGQPRDIMRPEHWRQRVRYVPAEPGWWLEIAGDHLDAAAKETAGDLGLAPDLLSHAISSLSTGERQRLALAMAFAARPDVLVLDEPTSALDEENRELVETLIRHAMQQGAAMLLASHDPAQIARLGLSEMPMKDGAMTHDH